MKISMLTADLERGASLNQDDAGVRGQLIATARSAVSWVRRLLCRLRGHEMTMRFEPNRLSLHCLECGACTQGWIIDVRPEFRRPRAPVVRVHRRDGGGPSRRPAQGEGLGGPRRVA